ncbi:hypothetical protein QTO34_011952 [Cnephaeus nilssonii]|uniref:Oncostatin-M n=1 Tax=Cnephaeus nilssonii TaxID=3371016 RepID=A0AA40LDS8_CNENI|nr:hypothetical protein QTO34_011952 [Eptesicus nilssonii]
MGAPTPPVQVRLLFLKPVLTGTCSGHGQELLTQLWNQANLMQDASLLLDPYIRIQGLDVSGLKESCHERPGVFPSAQALQELSRRGFLRTLHTQLGRALHRLAALQQDTPDVPAWRMARSYLLGMGNNVHCMAQLLPRAPRNRNRPSPRRRARGPPPGPPPPPTPSRASWRAAGSCTASTASCARRGRSSGSGGRP